MSIYLGNLTVDEIAQRAGVEFSQELRDFMEPRRQQNAGGVGQGQWHCFDIPFVLMCGDMETAAEIYRHLKDFSSDFKEPLQIALSGD